MWYRGRRGLCRKKWSGGVPAKVRIQSSEVCGSMPQRKAHDGKPGRMQRDGVKLRSSWNARGIHSISHSWNTGCRAGRTEKRGRMRILDFITRTIESH